MPVQVLTSRLSYVGPDRLDITRKTGDRYGLPFAPSWAILNPALRARREAEYLDVRAEVHAKNKLGVTLEFVRWILESLRIEDAAWERYRPAFVAEMRSSYRDDRAAWDALLARDRVVLCCFCKYAHRCHRFLLRTEILPKLGAVDGGEIDEWGDPI
jgi:hypothetical protein